MAEAKKTQKEEDQNSAEAGGQEIVVANLLRPVEGESVIWPGGVERRFTLVDRLGR